MAIAVGERRAVVLGRRHRRHRRRLELRELRRRHQRAHRAQRERHKVRALQQPVDALEVALRVRQQRLEHRCHLWQRRQLRHRPRLEHGVEQPLPEQRVARRRVPVAHAAQHVQQPVAVELRDGRAQVGVGGGRLDDALGDVAQRALRVEPQREAERVRVPLGADGVGELLLLLVLERRLGRRLGLLLRRAVAPAHQHRVGRAGEQLAPLGRLGHVERPDLVVVRVERAHALGAAQRPQLDEAVGARRDELQAARHKVELQHGRRVALEGAQAREVAHRPHLERHVARAARRDLVDRREGHRPHGALVAL